MTAVFLTERKSASKAALSMFIIAEALKNSCEL